MREARLSLPQLGLIAGTRAALGAGVGLLLADRLPEGQRRAVGWTLLAVGALSTIPLAFEVFGRRRRADVVERPESATADPWYGSTEPFRRGGVSVPS